MSLRAYLIRSLQLTPRLLASAFYFVKSGKTGLVYAERRINKNIQSTLEIMKTAFLFFLTITILLILTTVLATQGAPGLPSAPSQAPIDGGLGLLATAGGVYALKKLKRRKKEQVISEN